MYPTTGQPALQQFGGRSPPPPQPPGPPGIQPSAFAYGLQQQPVGQPFANFTPSGGVGYQPQASTAVSQVMTPASVPPAQGGMRTSVQQFSQLFVPQQELAGSKQFGQPSTPPPLARSNPPGYQLAMSRSAVAEPHPPTGMPQKHVYVTFPHIDLPEEEQGHLALLEQFLSSQFASSSNPEISQKMFAYFLWKDVVSGEDCSSQYLQDQIVVKAIEIKSSKKVKTPTSSSPSPSPSTSITGATSSAAIGTPVSGVPLRITNLQRGPGIKR